MADAYLESEDGVTFVNLESALGWFVLLENQDMADQIEILLPKTKVVENSAFQATAYFRTRATRAASLPTTARYRIDCLDTRQEVTGWTSLTPANSITIDITASDNNIISGHNTDETKQLIVQSDHGTDDQVTQAITYKVRNLYGISSS